jgi:hypothetical protein
MPNFALSSVAGRQPQLTTSCQGLRGLLGAKVLQTGRLRSQGRIEHCTTIWNPPSCPDAASPVRWISTLNSKPGWKSLSGITNPEN